MRCGLRFDPDKQIELMFTFDEIWKGAMFSAVIGGIITVVLLKLWEKKGTAPGKTVAGKRSNKRPTEHDERFC